MDSPIYRASANKAASIGRTWIVHTVRAPVQVNYEAVFWLCPYSTLFRSRMVAGVCPPLRIVENTHWGVLGQLHSVLLERQQALEVGGGTKNGNFYRFLPQNR